jgi:type I restriction enzyme S subunit
MKELSFDDVFDLKQGSHLSLNELHDDGSYNVFGANGIVGKYTKYMYEMPTVLVTCRGATCGSINLTTPNSWVTGNAIALNPKIGVDNKFIYYQLKGTNFYDVISGSAQPQIIVSTLKRKKIKIPDLKTQHDISQVLEEADKARQQRKAANALTDQFLQSSFLSLFGDLVINDKKFPVKRLDEIADVSSGVTKGRNLNGAEVISVPYMRVANVQDGHLNLSEIKEIEIREYELEKYLLHEGDILLTEGGDPDKLGRGAVWYNQIANCIHQNHIFKVRPDKKKFASEFLSYQFASPYGKRYFFKAAKQTTGIASINSTQLRAFPVIIPHLSLQQQFAGIVAQAEQLRQKQRESERELEGLFQSLLQRYFG